MDLKRLEQLLAEALSLASPAERAAFLDQACAGDPALRAEVELLLQSDQAAAGFLEQAAVAAQAGLDAHAETTGIFIGRYKLLQEIGDGGFGRVFMAEQTQPVYRRVALKIIKAGMDTREVVARFEAERQALALMDHPNIARVLDGGTTDSGRPYFVMELVNGLPITEYCDNYNLSTEQRLRLFIRVCHGVQHAHQKGIIHRDLKPSNILVTVIDGEPVPKIIDFGVAKALGQKLTERTLFTAFQQMIGTPAYMSPEQAELSGVDIDTRSDIYSLGVLLYELLTGVTPLDKEALARAALDEIRRMLRDTEPPKPSTRLQMLGEKLIEVARHRQTDAAGLPRLLHGDLDWVVMKCLEKDRARRYETANGLLHDIERHLAHQPVSAAKPSKVYAARKFVIRHRVGVSAFAAIALVLVLGLVLALLGFAEARGQRDRAIIAEQKEKENRQKVEEASAQTRKNYLEARLNLYAADMLDATRAVQENNFARAEQLLAVHKPRPGDPDVRGVEWRCNWALSQGDQIVRINMDDEVVELAISPDGKTCATASLDGEITIWDLETLRATDIFKTEPLPRSLTYSPDGKILAVAGPEGLKVWEVPSKRLLRSIAGKQIHTVAFSPDGKLLGYGIVRWPGYEGSEGITVICDAISGEERVRVPIGGFPLAFSPDSKRLAVGAPLRVLDTRDGKVMATARKGLFAQVCFSSDGGELFIIRNGALELWNFQTGSLESLSPPQYWKMVTRAPDNSMLILGAFAGAISLWDPSSRELLASLRGHQATLMGVAFTMDSKLILSCSRDQTIRIWRRPRPAVTPGRAKYNLFVDLGPAGAFCRFSSDGQWLAVSREDGLRVVDVARRRTRQVLTTGAAPVGFLPDNSTLLAADLSNSGSYLQLWNWRFNEEHTIPLRGLPLNYEVAGYALDPDGKHVSLLIVTNMVRKLFSAEVKTGECRVHDLPLEYSAGGGIAFSPNAQFMAIGQVTCTKLYSWPELILLRTFGTNETGVLKSVFSSDSTKLAIALWDGALRIYAIPSGELLSSVKGQNVTAALSFTPDNKSLVSRKGGKTTLWHMPTQRASMVWPDTMAIEFSPNGSDLVQVRSDLSLYFLRLPAINEIDRLESEPLRPLREWLDMPEPGFQPLDDSIDR